MDTPNRYATVSPKALEVKKHLGLTDVQTLLYDHVCRGDFKLINEDGQLFYDENNGGFGYYGDRNWVKKQFKPLLDAKLVLFKSLNDCRDSRYTSWYFYGKGFKLDDLIDASCYVSASQLFLVKHYLNLPDGFNKRNAVYGDLKLIYNTKEYQPYAFVYKGEKSDWYYESFYEMIGDLWGRLENEGKKYLGNIPGTTTRRQFQLTL